jgi:hypothetical protein
MWLAYTLVRRNSASTIVQKGESWTERPMLCLGSSDAAHHGLMFRDIAALTQRLIKLACRCKAACRLTRFQGCEMKKPSASHQGF